MRRTTTAVLAAVLLTATACGSDTSTASSPGPSADTATPTAAAATTAAPDAPGDCVPDSTDGSGAVPTLSGTPMDTTVAPTIGVGGDNPPTTLKMADVVEGTGPAAVATSSVVVNYTGVFYCDGATFDSSWTTGQPVPFSLAEVIPGFTQGITGMKAGGRRELVIPPDLGYGASDQRGLPGGSTLVFVVDLVSFS